MGGKIKTIPKEKMKGIKERSPYLIDEGGGLKSDCVIVGNDGVKYSLMFSGFKLFNVKKEKNIMTKEEIKKVLDNTKVYVNGKSEEIQKKLFSFGCRWTSGYDNKINYIYKPFLFIDDELNLSYGDNVLHFADHQYREITAEQILSLELTEQYRPFKDQEECWNEMMKHQPFGWVKSKDYGYFSLIGFVRWANELEDVMITFAASAQLERSSRYLFKNYIFADGAPFGIKE